MGHPRLQVRVECRSGHRGEQEPDRFFLGERKVEVLEILDRWPAPDHGYFKLRGYDEGIYILRHDASANFWELIAFTRGCSSTSPDS